MFSPELFNKNGFSSKIENVAPFITDKRSATNRTLKLKKKKSRKKTSLLQQFSSEVFQICLFFNLKQFQSQVLRKRSPSSLRFVFNNNISRCRYCSMKKRFPFFILPQFTYTPSLMLNGYKQRRLKNT